MPNVKRSCSTTSWALCFQRDPLTSGNWTLKERDGSGHLAAKRQKAQLLVTIQIMARGMPAKMNKSNNIFQYVICPPAHLHPLCISMRVVGPAPSAGANTPPYCGRTQTSRMCSKMCSELTSAQEESIRFEKISNIFNILWTLLWGILILESINKNYEFVNQ